MALVLNVKSLRLRLGWTQADLARRLNCASYEVESWETGQSIPNSQISSQLELLLSQADACAFEMQSAPKAESFCEKQRLGQIDIHIVEDNETP